MQTILIRDTFLNAFNNITINSSQLELYFLDLTEKKTKIFIKNNISSSNFSLPIKTDLILKQEPENVNFSF